MELYETEVLQHEEELREFLKLIRGEQISSYLEIGSKFGGSLWQVAQVMQPRSRIVAVDIRRGHRKWRESEPSLEACIAKLNEMGHDARVLWGDSTDKEIVHEVQLNGPYDLVLIDANHTLPFVTKDWENYGPMVSIVAFHDIAWKRPDDFDGYSRIDVPMLWFDLRTRYRSSEITLDPSGQDNGIGVLWRVE
jgi:predicted O-methyltransferase YrrM